MNYIRNDGELLAIAPIRMTTLLYTFMLDADWNALNRICDRCLNLGGSTVYRPLFPGVFLYCSKLNSFPMAEPVIGWCPEYDFGIWMPVAAGRVKGDVFHPESIAAYTPYIWVDNGVAMLGGRTVYGFAKAIGSSMTMPQSPGDPANFHLETQVIETYGPDSEVVTRPLLDVHRLDAGLWDKLTQAAKSARNGLDTLHDIIAGQGPGHLPWPDPAFLLRAIQTLQHRLPLVLLKQFPDATDGRKACYQALIQGNVDITSPVEWGLLGGEYGVTISQYDSHNIVRELGLKAAQTIGRQSMVKSLFHAWMKFDGLVNPGTVIYDSGGATA